MAESHNLGKQGEDFAVKYLQEKGYKVLRRNWRSGKVEIDIIAEDKDFIVFAEVKTRSDDFLDDPRNAVSTDKQRSIIFAADNYVKWNYVEKESRFDVIIVLKKSESLVIDEHIEGAFYPTLR